MQVNFMVIGAMKSATTSLCTMLSLHPDIGFSIPKEPEFFNLEADWRNNINCSLDKAIKTFPLLIDNCRYFTQLLPFIDKFSISNILILLFEDFVKDQITAVRKMIVFLGLSFNKYPKNILEIHENESARKKFKPLHAKEIIPAAIKLISNRVYKKSTLKQILIFTIRFVNQNQQKNYKSYALCRN